MDAGRAVELKGQVLHERDPVFGAIGGLGVRGLQPCAEEDEEEVAADGKDEEIGAVDTVLER